MDSTKLIHQINDFFLINRVFSYLPRKYKMSISSSIYNSEHIEIQLMTYTSAAKIKNKPDIPIKGRFGFYVFLE
ncbi:hypothetical protein [Paenibacillus sp. Root444D2]|uniref:hypothetical protein n=1 Tax=Paenibacillus sp. Root444D2 TaxID=1736538 RepID=UPI00070D0CAF|nr:hypothetical protein [Paenibacillus sp. Root444D2]